MSQTLTIKGTITHIGQMEKVGENNKVEFTVKQEGDYGKPARITLFGKSAPLIEGKYVGMEVSVNVNISSREYNNKWYTEVQGWKFN